jgi:hypothetical protein
MISITHPAPFNHTKDFKASTEFNIKNGLSQVYKPVSEGISNVVEKITATRVDSPLQPTLLKTAMSESLSRAMLSVAAKLV